METLFKVLSVGIIAIAGFVVVFAGVSLLCAIPTLLLWNWLMPVIFGVTKITFWQAVGVNFLTAVLFKSYNFNSSKKD